MVLKHCPAAQYLSSLFRMCGKRRLSLFCLLFMFLLVVVVTAVNSSPVDFKLDETFVSEENLPLCVGNLLDRRRTTQRNNNSSDSSDVVSRLLTSFANPWDGQRCRLMSYTDRPIVNCLDALFNHHVAKNGSKFIKDDDELIFVFMGDSRIRQQFLNFIKIIPNYDQVRTPNPIPPKYHGDIEVTSRILRLRVSFRWHPLINDQLINTLNRIMKTAASSKTRPHFILLSMASWHMLREHGADFHLYQKRLTQIGPILASMLSSSSVGRIVWLRQYTSLDLYGDNGKSTTLVVSNKIHHYNLAAIQRLMIKNRRIDFWDSGDPFANEYARGCALIQRYEHLSFNTQEYATAYANCNDYIHTGYSALSLATQLLFNDVCNAHM